MNEYINEYVNVRPVFLVSSYIQDRLRIILRYQKPITEPYQRFKMLLKIALK